MCLCGLLPVSGSGKDERVYTIEKEIMKQTISLYFVYLVMYVEAIHNIFVTLNFLRKSQIHRMVVVVIKKGLYIFFFDSSSIRFNRINSRDLCS